MNQHVSQDLRARVLARDHRRCQLCMRYFGDHRVMDVVEKDPEKYEPGDAGFMTVCTVCSEVIHNLRRKTA